MADELLDLVDKDGNVIGTALRDECHNNPKLMHAVVHCWIFNSKGQVLWQQRSLKKALSPGMWDISCGGHIKSGSTPEQTLLEELDEELGVMDARPIFVEKYVAGNKKQTELIYLYYTVVDRDEKEFQFNDGEVEQVKWFDIHEALLTAHEKKVESKNWIFSQMPRILQFVFSNKNETNSI